LSILAFIYFGKQVLTVILFVFFGFVIMSSVKPIVNWLRKKGFSKGLAITVAYFLLILIILGLIFLVSIPFVNQLAGLVSVLPGWINEALLFLEDFSVAGYSVDLDAISGYVTDFIKGFPTVANVKNIATFVSDFFGVGAFLLTSLVFSIYLLSEHDTFADVLLIKIVSDEKRKRVKKLVMDVENKLGSWVLGQAVVSVTATIFSWIVLTILGVPFALPLAMFAGLINVIPNLGSTLAGFTMSLVALITVGPINALVMLVAYVIYQMVENSLIVPKVMGNAVGLKPIVVMLGVIVFLIFFGLIGGFMAVPLMVIAQIVYEFYIDLQKLEAKGIV
jgi:predicted PurR-regulated permease PerM